MIDPLSREESRDRKQSNLHLSGFPLPSESQQYQLQTSLQQRFSIGTENSGIGNKEISIIR